MVQTVLCFGDSNTYGSCADPSDTRSDDPVRFAPEERWTGLLARALAPQIRVVEAGLPDRTTAVPDPKRPGISAVEALPPCLTAHRPVDLLILMQGTNDTKARLHLSAADIALGLESVVRQVQGLDCWADGPRILLLAPPPLAAGVEDPSVTASMGIGSIAKSRQLPALLREVAARTGCAFLDTTGLVSLSPVDGIHFTKAGHCALAHRLAALVPELLRRDRS